MTPTKIYFASSSQFRLWAEGQHWSQDENVYKGKQLCLNAFLWTF